MSERTEILQSGVEGYRYEGDQFPTTNIRVAAFAEIDGRMYVGGKFSDVRRTPTSLLTRQSYLAAFDRDTGAWIDSFRPTLNGVVWDLKVAPDGDLIVAGQFTTVNGSLRSGIAKIDPRTSAVDPNWNVALQLTGSTNRPLVRTLDIEGDWLYLGGNFTRVRGTDGVMRNAANLARVNINTAAADESFRPFIEGVVFDVDADGDRVYTVGNWQFVNNEWSPGHVVLDRTTARAVPGLQRYVTTTPNPDLQYQQAILSLGSEVWQAGSQHNIQAYRASDYQLLRSFVSDPWGDGQALIHRDGIVYAGNHATDGTFMYTDAIAFPITEDTTWTTRRPQRWMGAWERVTKTFLDWYPQIGSQNGEGAWELFFDSTGCLWAGGDFNRGSFDGEVPRYVGGFAKFCRTDSTPPAPPTDLTAAYRAGDRAVDLSWSPSAGDNRGGEVRYELLKNDSVLASFISITTFRDVTGTPTDRYFVRAKDSTGNRSATTPVAIASSGADTQAPTTPQNLAAVVQPNGDVQLSWDASVDDVGVAEYRVLRTAVQIDSVTSVGFTDPAPGEGSYWYQVQALDAAGNESFRTPPVRVDITDTVTDTERPSTPSNLTADVQPNGSVQLSWEASTDNVGVAEYRVLRTLREVGSVATVGFTDPGPGRGSFWYQVQALDAAGNESARSAPLRVDVVINDSEAPSTPSNLTAVVEADGDVLLSWDASTDNVGVIQYRVLRTLSQVGSAPSTSFTDPRPGRGVYWYQVLAVDAAGNESARSAPVRVVVGL